MNRKALLLAIVVLCMLLVGNVHALQISVDGHPSDWTTEASVATSPLISDPPAGWDISEVFFTNDENNFYWRIDTYAPQQWNLPPDNIILQICMNTDNDISTGAPSRPGCTVFATEGLGYDYMILVSSNGTPTPTIETYFCQPDCIVPASPAQVASIDTVTEIGIPISDLNISGCTAGSDCTIPVTVYSTQVPVLVDWVPDPDVTFNVTIPGPTAVSLNTFSATSFSTNTILWFACAILGLSAVGLYIYHRKVK